VLPSFDDLGTDVLANIFGCLGPMDIMRARLNKKMGEAAKTTIVPPTEFIIYGVRKYNAMTAMTTALPHLQQLSISGLGHGHKYNNGEDPDERRAATRFRYHIPLQQVTQLRDYQSAFEWKISCPFQLPTASKVEDDKVLPTEVGS